MGEMSTEQGVRVLLSRQTPPKTTPYMYSTWTDVESILIRGGRTWRRMYDGGLQVLGEARNLLAEFPHGQWRGVSLEGTPPAETNA